MHSNFRNKSDDNVTPGFIDISLIVRIFHHIYHSDYYNIDGEKSLECLRGGTNLKRFYGRIGFKRKLILSVSNGFNVGITFNFVWHFSIGFLAEIILPVLFMFFLIMIKSVTTKYDSPNISYHCGEAYPWAYSNSVSAGNMLKTVPYQCGQQPNTCSAENYYRSRRKFDALGFKGYTENGKELLHLEEGRYLF